jgi:hypothetical protein
MWGCRIRAYRQQMLPDALRCRRSAVVLGAGLVAGVVLTGCAARGTAAAPAAATGPAQTSTAPATGSDLVAGLLPAEAFGEGTEVHRFPMGDADLGHWDHGWQDDGRNVTPAQCMTAMDQASSQLSGMQDAAGQVARTGGVRTFELLAVPATQVDVVKQVRTAVAACGSMTFTESHHGADMKGTVSIQELPGLPADMAAVSMTFSGDYPGGSWSETALAGVAQDGDRVLALMQNSHDGHDQDAADGSDAAAGTPLDPGAFTALLQRAYQTQADAMD